MPKLRNASSTKLSFLGYVTGLGEVSMEEQKVSAVSEGMGPTRFKMCSGSWGLLTSIIDSVAAPLTDMLKVKKKGSLAFYSKNARHAERGGTDHVPSASGN